MLVGDQGQAAVAAAARWQDERLTVDYHLMTRPWGGRAQGDGGLLTSPETSAGYGAAAYNFDKNCPMGGGEARSLDLEMSNSLRSVE